MNALLAATLIQTLRDANKPRMAQEVREFVLSDFCALMCECLGIDHRAYVDAYRRVRSGLRVPQMRPGPVEKAA